MRYVRAFLRFVWDFVVGDDWRIAVGVVVGLGVTDALAHGRVTAWWVMPVVVALLLAFSLWRASSSASARR